MFILHSLVRRPADSDSAPAVSDVSVFASGVVSAADIPICYFYLSDAVGVGVAGCYLNVVVYLNADNNPYSSTYFQTHKQKKK